MPFGVKTLRTILQICFGIPPLTVNLCTDFRQHLHLTDTEIGELLTEITICTGLAFPSNTTEHLTDVFDLLIHVILRLDEDCDTVDYFELSPEKWGRQSPAEEYTLKRVSYVVTHLN